MLLVQLRPLGWQDWAEARGEGALFLEEVWHGKPLELNPVAAASEKEKMTN